MGAFVCPLSEAVCCMPLERLRRRVKVRTTSLTVRTETKTKDNVFVRISLVVQYRLLRSGGGGLAEHAVAATYKVCWSGERHGSIQSFPTTHVV